MSHKRNAHPSPEERRHHLLGGFRRHDDAPSKQTPRSVNSDFKGLSIGRSLAGKGIFDQLFSDIESIPRILAVLPRETPGISYASAARVKESIYGRRVGQSRMSYADLIAATLKRGGLNAPQAVNPITVPIVAQTLRFSPLPEASKTPGFSLSLAIQDIADGHKRPLIREEVVSVKNIAGPNSHVTAGPVSSVEHRIIIAEVTTESPIWYAQDRIQTLAQGDPSRYPITLRLGSLAIFDPEQLVASSELPPAN